ncbi:DUF982 domain-containing protein [Mesorhizobium sp. BR1-1-9]|uniref:DUF982 domain-containing protein n=1 Tax=unclassified Mesorhizobium TaxID=325217 RepID=UPI00112ABD05|nr:MULTISPECIES: DUF982 domain-containing protein [unclassified Mesorhizobium]MBZ9809931.1 DUF982 domain-containing protein [Mesorhizobium sp. ESP-6-2]MBZ9874827.1 DUF982 domain-containing protein [Mesorhizobium sp. BR1-1-9]MBZ9945234.1 DUF982 domain-containing protein [Mesorhizobium sp. BR1-1-13]TPM26630.1 DUF982 domain-containing protein [Mesorhizobium sp. B2-2-2]
MNDKMFEQPVLVKNGDFMIEEVACLEDAFEFLQNWPRNRRGPIFETALRACQRAYDGHVPASLARDAFAGFARSARILEDVSTSIPWMAGVKTGRGGVSA